MRALATLLALLLCAPSWGAGGLVGCEEHSAAGTPDRTVQVPDGTLDGHTMLAFYSHHADDALPVTLSDFTPGDALHSPAGTDATVAWWIRTASSEPASYTFDSDASTTANGTAFICTFSGVDGLDVTWVRASHYVTAENDDTPTAQPITTVTDGAMVVVFSDVALNNVSNMACPSSGGTWSEIDAIDDGANRHANICVHTQATAGTVTPGASNHTGIAATDETRFFTLALKPAAESTGAHYYHLRH